jgi:hypothetical protein
VLEYNRFMRFHRNGILCLMAVVCVVVSSAAEKKRDWLTGKVLDTNRQRYFAGTIGSANTNGNASDSGSYSGTTYGSQRAVYRVYETFVIEGDQYVYLAQERLKWRWSKPANVTVNGTVQYVVDKRKLIVLDEDGKEHEMEIIKKTLRQEDQK